MAQYRTDQSKYLNDSKTIFEVGMFNDRLTPSGTLTDAFGRLRVSEPFTLFDSFHRYEDNGKWATSNTAGGTYAFSTNQSLINLSVTTASGAEVVRETKRVFAYQPGKSLLIMSTFAMATPQANNVQRVGYFNDQNGIFFEANGTTLNLVKRTYTSGSVQETRVPQSSWNKDKFDGTGASAQGSGSEHSTGLDVTKTNIFWMDVEWLGVGDVRCGFVVDGKLMIAHIFHNDNNNTVPYMTTAILPIRYEIRNIGITDSAATMKQICSTVLSEGGYELRGKPRTIGNGIVTADLITLTTAGTFYPLQSIRLKATRLDAIVVPKNISVLGTSNTTRYKYKIVSEATITGANWQPVTADSAVEYNANTTATMSGGVDLLSGFFTVSNQSAPSIAIDSGVFKFQLERNGLTNTPTTFTLAITGASNGDTALGSIDWEEIT